MAEGQAENAPDELFFGDGVLRFLSSLGQRSEAELYLRLFRSLPPGRFALLVPTRGVLTEHAASLAEHLSFLRTLGLLPSLLLGGVDEVSEELEASLQHALEEAKVPFRRFEVTSASFSNAGLPASSGELNVYCLKNSSESLLRDVVATIAPRKTIFLRRAGGLGQTLGPRVEIAPGHVLPQGPGGIGVINLRSDAAELRASSLLQEEETLWLDRCDGLLNRIAAADPRATISIASPLSLLRELFTVRGDGTLLKRGSSIMRVETYDSETRGAVRELLEDAFSRPVVPAFFKRPPLRVYLEQQHRGLAFLEAGPSAWSDGPAFLSKFAVLPVAQGEGVGQDLFWELSKDTPAFYWRARSKNPINNWYATVCDGLHRAGEWNVFWRGVAAESLPVIVADALSRPEDFQATQDSPRG